jgi:hypothetical protein
MCRKRIRFSRNADHQHADSNHGNDLDLPAKDLQVFEELLLLESVAVGGFANHLQLIFDALERGVLLHHLFAQAAMLRLELGQATLKRRKIDLRCEAGALAGAE